MGPWQPLDHVVDGQLLMLPRQQLPACSRVCTKAYQPTLSYPLPFVSHIPTPRSIKLGSLVQRLGCRIRRYARGSKSVNYRELNRQHSPDASRRSSPYSDVFIQVHSTGWYSVVFAAGWLSMTVARLLGETSRTLHASYHGSMLGTQHILNMLNVECSQVTCEYSITVCESASS